MSSKIKTLFALAYLLSAGALVAAFLLKTSLIILGIMAVCLVSGIIAGQRRSSRMGELRRKYDLLEDNARAELKGLQKEISFYEEESRQLIRRSHQRRQLSAAARDLGVLLDPTEIQRKLVQAAQALFPGQPASLSYGQAADPIDTLVVRRRQPILTSEEKITGPPLMAVPVSVQRQVVGVLRVGGAETNPVSRQDMRVLDSLASIASLAMDNSLLFSQVQDTALRDGLTGLLTRRAFQDRFEEAIREASRYQQPLSLIMADIDHFKSVNDTHGHQAGDQVIQGLAHVLYRNVRDVDVVARYGGEEFVVILFQTAHAEALQIAEHMRQDLEAQEFEVGAKSLRITGSFGVATFPEDATSSQQLLRQADQRLYHAKESGRNRVRGRAA